MSLESLPYLWWLIITHSSGFSSGFYSASDLRSDYRRGLVSAITFCLFAMPMLMSQESDEVDAGRGVDDVPEGDQVWVGSRETGNWHKRWQIFCFLQWANPGLFLFICVLSKHKFSEKTLGFSGIRTRIVRVEGEHADHLTTTTANLLLWAWNVSAYCV